MLNGKIIAIAGLLFVAPIAVVMIVNADTLRDSYHIEAGEAEGKVLYFTAPNR